MNLNSYAHHLIRKVDVWFNFVTSMFQHLSSVPEDASEAMNLGLKVAWLGKGNTICRNDEGIG